MQHRLVAGYAVQGDWTAWPLKMGPIGCPETSVTNYQSTLRKNPRRVKISFTPRRKPEITQSLRYLTSQYALKKSLESSKHLCPSQFYLNPGRAVSLSGRELRNKSVCLSCFKQIIWDYWGCSFKKSPGCQFMTACRSNINLVRLRQLNTIVNCIRQQKS